MKEINKFERWVHKKVVRSSYVIPFWRTRRNWRGPFRTFSRWPDIRLFKWDLSYMGPDASGFTCINCKLSEHYSKKNSS